MTAANAGSRLDQLAATPATRPLSRDAQRHPGRDPQALPTAGQVDRASPARESAPGHGFVVRPDPSSRSRPASSAGASRATTCRPRSGPTRPTPRTPPRAARGRTSAWCRPPRAVPDPDEVVAAVGVDPAQLPAVGVVDQPPPVRAVLEGQVRRARRARPAPSAGAAAAGLGHGVLVGGRGRSKAGQQVTPDLVEDLLHALGGGGQHQHGVLRGHDDAELAERPVAAVAAAGVAPQLPAVALRPVGVLLAGPVSTWRCRCSVTHSTGSSRSPSRTPSSSSSWKNAASPSGGRAGPRSPGRGRPGRCPTWRA